MESKNRKAKLLGTVKIEAGRPILKVSWGQYLKLIYRAVRQLALSGYNPDLIISIATGGLYGVMISRALKKPRLIWWAQGYVDKVDKTKVKGGRRKKGVYFTRDILFIDPKTGRPVRLTRKNWKFKRVLVIDDLDDSGRTLHKAKALLIKWFGSRFDIKTLCIWHKSLSSFFVDYVGQVVPSKLDGYRKLLWIDQPHERLERNLGEKYKTWKRNRG